MRPDPVKVVARQVVQAALEVWVAGLHATSRRFDLSATPLGA
jgi:hypothetical protein